MLGEQGNNQSAQNIVITQTTKIVNNQILQFQTKWLAIGHGIHKQKSYQYVYRPFIPQSKTPGVKRTVDGIQIIPIIQYPTHKQIVFIANFRPSVGKFVIQFPAGLVEGQDMYQNAKRQLQQQTGLIAYKFLQIPSPQIYSVPQKGNESGIFCIALIDGSKQESFVPFKREQGQNIRCYSLKYNKEIGIISVLQQFSKQNDYVYEAKTWLVCMTVDLTQKFKQLNINLNINQKVN